jgi:hypothetical protein
MTADAIDDPAMDWGRFDPEQRQALMGMSDNDTTARRLFSCIATSGEHPDGGESLHQLLLEITTGGDLIGVLLAAAAEYVRLAYEVYGSNTGVILRVRAERQMDLAAKNKRDGG